LVLEPHLKFSPAVLATGPSGTHNTAMKDMDENQVWQLAARTAKAMLDEIGAPVV
jgi:hypothetical protein